MNLFLKIISNKVVKNAGWMIAGKVFQFLINLVVGLMTARYLGPANYGLINYAQAFTTFFSAVCTLGIHSVIIRELIENPLHEGKILGTSLGLKIISSILSALVIIGISSVWDANEPQTRLVVALYSIGLVFQAIETFSYWFQSKLQSKKVAIASLTAYTIAAAYRIVLLALGKTVEYFALATAVDFLFLGIILLYCYYRDGGQKLTFSWTYGKSLLSRSSHYILSGMMVAIYAQTDKIMLKQMMGETEIGYYATAVSLCNVWCFVLSAVIDSVNPVIVQKHKEDRMLFNSMNRALYCFIFYVCILVSFVFVFFGEWIVLLLYGKAYVPAAVPLRVITWYTGFSYLGVARNVWVVCENKQRYLKYIYFSAAVANVVLNFLLIPGWGSVGAAIASLMAQITTVMIAPFFIPAMRENSVMMLEAIFFRNIRFMQQDNGR